MANDPDSLEEYDRVSHERTQAKRACEAAVGTDEYEALLKIFRKLDHEKEDLMERRRANH